MSRFLTLITTATSLRALVLLLAGGLMLSDWRPSQLLFERELFQLGSALMEPASNKLRVGIVELSSDEMAQLTYGAFDLPEAANKSSPLSKLSRLLAGTSAPVGIVAHAPLGWLDSKAMTQLKSLKLPTNQSSLKTFLRRRQQLQKHLLNPKKATLGLVQASCHTKAAFDRPFAQPVNVLTDKAQSHSRIGSALHWLQPALPQLLSTHDSSEQRGGAKHVPLAHCTGLSQPLLWNLQLHNLQQQPQKQVVTDLVLADFALTMHQRLSRAKLVRWEQYGDLILGKRRLPISQDGKIIPFIPAAVGKPTIVQFSLNEYNKAKRSKIILIGEAGDPALMSTALSIQALKHKSYLYTPVAGHWLHKLSLIILAVYLVLVLPKVSAMVGTLMSCLVATAMLVAQLGWQITQSLWLPLYEPLCFLFIGHLLMLIWLAQHYRQQHWIKMANAAQYQLALQLYRDGRNDDALSAVAGSTTSSQMLELLYDIGAQFERKRLYADAHQTYQVIKSRKRHYRDVSAKIAKLKTLQQDSSLGLGANMALAKTLVLSDAKVNKPVLGRYEIEKEIGRGAMGVVYLGRDPKIARQVAIKTFNYDQFDPKQLPELKQRFFREAEAAGRLNHPSIVTVYDVGEERDLSFIAMDYLEGKPLNEFIHKSSLLSVKQVYHIMAKVAEALHFAHSKNIVHRDVKPANIIYNEKNAKVTVTDFGIARITDDSRTRTGDVIGSPLYMSPEQLRGDKVEYAADIFSLGITMYQLLTGELPFQGDNLANLTYKIIHSEHKGVREWCGDLPTSATRIINKALHKDPANRFASAREMCNAIQRSFQRDFSATISN